MNIFQIIKLLIVINTLVFLSITSTFAQDAEKVKDSTDTALVDGVKQIQKSKKVVEGSLDETSVENKPGGIIESDLEDNTNNEAEVLADTEQPEPRISIEESLTRPLYQATGKRDPFKPFIKEPKEQEATISETTPPIKRFPLDEYRIVGIVWVNNVPKAMVVDPEKNTYFLGKADEIGNKNGVILEVTENGLLVNEKRLFEDVFGEQKVEIKKSVLAFADEEDRN